MAFENRGNFMTPEKRLMLAAPELLAALKRLLDCTGENADDLLEEVAEAAESARALIARIEAT